MTALKRLPHAGGIDFTGWDWGFGQLNGHISEYMTAYIEAVEKDTPLTIGLASIWKDEDGQGGPKPEKPWTFHIADIMEPDCYPWEVTLDDIVADLVAEHNGDFSNRDRSLLEAWAADLRKFAAILDEAALKVVE